MRRSIDRVGVQLYTVRTEMQRDFEFARIGDTVPFDVLLADTDPALVQFELDVYWITRAGSDPISSIRSSYRHLAGLNSD